MHLCTVSPDIAFIPDKYRVNSWPKDVAKMNVARRTRRTVFRVLELPNRSRIFYGENQDKKFRFGSPEPAERKEKAELKERYRIRETRTSTRHDHRDWGF